MQLKDRMYINGSKVEEFQSRNKIVVFVDNQLIGKTFDEACKDLRRAFMEDAAMVPSGLEHRGV
jgi:hypothetical protein